MATSQTAAFEPFDVSYTRNAERLKNKLVTTLRNALMQKQAVTNAQRINEFLTNFPGYNAFTVFNKTFTKFKFIEKNIPVIEDEELTMWIQEGHLHFEEAKEIYKLHINLARDYGAVEHTLSMFLNLVPSKEAFYEVFPENHIDKVLSNYTESVLNFKRTLRNFLSSRDSLNANNNIKYEAFLHRHQEEIATAKKYFIYNLLGA